MEFKDRLIKLRKELNLTQEELAQKIGYTRTAISAWEIGRNEPSNADTIKLAKYFGVSTDYLLGKSDIRNPEKEDLDKLQIGLSTKDYSNISDEQLKQIEDFAKFVLKDNKKEDKEKNENNKG